MKVLNFMKKKLYQVSRGQIKGRIFHHTMEKERYSKMQRVLEMNPLYNLTHKLLLQLLLSLPLRVYVVPVGW